MVLRYGGCRLYRVGLSNGRRVYLPGGYRVALWRGDRGRGGGGGDDVLRRRGGHGAGGYGFVPFAAATAPAGGEHHAQCGYGAGGAKDAGMSGCHVASPGCNVLHKIDHGGIIFLALGGARCFGQKASVAAGRGARSVVRQRRTLPQGGADREFVAPGLSDQAAARRGGLQGRGVFMGCRRGGAACHDGGANMRARFNALILPAAFAPRAGLLEDVAVFQADGGEAAAPDAAGVQGDEVGL